MRRKLISQGRGGITLTLPINWVRQHHLREGDEVTIEETEQGLRVAGQGERQEKEVSLVLTSHDRRMILNLLNQSYRLGYGRIVVVYANVEQYHQIWDICRTTLLGFEIVEQKGNQCVLENIAEPAEEKFEVILRKLFLQIIELSLDVASQVKGLSAVVVPRGEDRKLQIDKLTNYTRRALLRQSLGKEKSALLYSIISLLSLVAHGYWYLCSYTLQEKVKLHLETLHLLEKTNLMLREYYDSFYARDVQSLCQLSSWKDKLWKENTRLLELSSGPESVVLAYLREIIRLIHVCHPPTIGYLM